MPRHSYAYMYVGCVEWISVELYCQLIVNMWNQVLFIHTPTQTHTNTHTDIHIIIYIHTYMHTYIHNSVVLGDISSNDIRLNGMGRGLFVCYLWRRCEMLQPDKIILSPSSDSKWQVTKTVKWIYCVVENTAWQKMLCGRKDCLTENSVWCSLI